MLLRAIAEWFCEMGPLEADHGRPLRCQGGWFYTTVFENWTAVDTLGRLSGEGCVVDLIRKVGKWIGGKVLR